MEIAPLEKADQELSNGAGNVKIRHILRKLWPKQVNPKR